MGYDFWLAVLSISFHLATVLKTKCGVAVVPEKCSQSCSVTSLDFVHEHKMDDKFTEDLVEGGKFSFSYIRHILEPFTIVYFELSTISLVTLRI